MNPPQYAGSGRSKVTVNMILRQVAMLDMLAIAMRPKRRLRVTRSDLIEGIIESAQRSGVDLSETCSEQEITETMLNAWSGKRKHRG
jgi:hypothetical protein